MHLLKPHPFLKKILIIFLINLSILGCLAQGNEAQSDKLMVASPSGVFIRDTSSLISNKICSIQFGEMVTLLGRTFERDTVNGMIGEWWKIKYNSCTGYVFNNYLANIHKENPRFNHLPQIFKLTVACGESRYFNSDYYWYGVFSKDESWSISSVKVKFSVNKENYSDEMYDQYLKISIDKGDDPLFLIGFPDSLGHLSTKKRSLKKGILFPGQAFGVGYKDQTSYYLAAYGATSPLKKGQSYQLPYSGMKNYELKIIGTHRDSVSEFQDIWLDVKERVINESMPYIMFAGDLNNDSIPDIILSHSPDYRWATTYLFMSGYDKNKIITKVGEYKWETCY